MKSTLKSLIAVALAATVIVSCQTSNAVKGGAIGAAGGGVLGGVIAGKDNTAEGAIIGAVIGGTAGALIGNRMDKQAEELRADLEGAEVERVGEGIKITFDSGLMFATNKSDLNPATKTNLQELATTLQKYEDTNVLIEGHTDATGSEDYNLKLSKQRASSVEDYLIDLGVGYGRLQTQGYGELQPVASNDNASGRQQNRRVEIAIYANKKMQRMAKRGELGQE
ncbi:OmpA family protein [Roseivirga pacifica]|uniref:OmpA family protein n=1 Tax=Roseivirga pacifica TaxID=1267423 RepID=UPI002094F005|nr:OmpA family protein [Roseivirga pacifica]MCO6360846.1 OmpA family protein [Roseivirga pacifica]MCO6368735.1 OmpA family protein [Roseivirga pacifica]MCO6372878.1 OmpA family protein [Roseivirga pacifica]MCO6376937.1 OmpA family protein [Roseivirga pacifica]MCO6377785.1 OmpA family protein [Roseivirga pacifica]